MSTRSLTPAGLDRSTDAAIVIRSARWKALLLLTVTAGFAAVGVLMMRDPSAAVPDWVCAVFFGLGAVVAGAQLIVGSRLILSPSGMRLEHFGRSRSWIWADVSDFRIWTS